MIQLAGSYSCCLNETFIMFEFLLSQSIKISKEANDTIGDVVRKGQAACQQLPNKFPSNNGKSNRERHDPPDYMDKKKIMIVKKFLNLILSQIEEQKKIYIF